MPNNKVITLDNLSRFKDDLYNDAPWGSGGSSFAKAFHYTGEAFDDPSSPGQENFHFDVVSDEVDTILSEFPACVYFDDMYKQLELLLYMDTENLQMAVYNVMEDNTQYTIQFQRASNTTTITGWVRNYNGATKKDIDISNNSDQWSSAQLEEVYTTKHDVINVVSSTGSTIIYKVDDLESNSSMLIYWGFVVQQGLTMFIFSYDDSQDTYSLSTQAVPFLPGIDPATDIGKVVTVDAQGEYSLEAPAGGTKLYLHKLTCDTGFLTLVSTISSSLATKTLIPANLGFPTNGNIQSVMCYVQDPLNYHMVPVMSFKMNMGTISKAYYIDNDGAIQSITLASPINSDTVTEL